MRDWDKVALEELDGVALASFKAAKQTLVERRREATDRAEQAQRAAEQATIEANARYKADLRRAALMAIRGMIDREIGVSESEPSNAETPASTR